MHTARHSRTTHTCTHAPPPPCRHTHSSGILFSSVVALALVRSPLSVGSVACSVAVAGGRRGKATTRTSLRTRRRTCTQRNQPPDEREREQGCGQTRSGAKGDAWQWYVACSQRASGCTMVVWGLGAGCGVHEEVSLNEAGAEFLSRTLVLARVASGVSWQSTICAKRSTRRKMKSACVWSNSRGAFSRGVSARVGGVRGFHPSCLLSL